MNILGITTAIAIAMGGILIGLFTATFGDVILAIREIALNTRRQPARTEYRALEIIAALYRVFGWIIAIGGVLVGVIMLIGSLA